MYTRTVVQALSSLVDARNRCLDSSELGKLEWAGKHEEAILSLVDNHLPSGSGWDSGTKLDLDRSTPEKLVLYGSYHHMNDGGYYDGYTDHTITVTASLQFGITLKITGRNRNEIKDYLHELFDSDLRKEVDQ